MQLLAALPAGATSALLVVLADRNLDVGPGRFGLLIAAIGVGAGLGPPVLRRLIADPRRPGILFGPYLLRGGVDLTLAASSSFGVAVVSLGACGLGTSTGMVTYNSMLQTTVPDRLTGRVFAFYDVMWQGGRLVSIAMGGVLADAIGVAPSTCSAAFSCWWPVRSDWRDYVVSTWTRQRSPLAESRDSPTMSHQKRQLPIRPAMRSASHTNVRAGSVPVDLDLIESK